MVSSSGIIAQTWRKCEAEQIFLEFFFEDGPFPYFHLIIAKRLHRRQMALLVPDVRLLHFSMLKIFFCEAEQPIFHPG